LIGAALLVAAIIALVLTLAGRGDNQPSRSANRSPSVKTTAAKSTRTTPSAAAASQPPPPPPAKPASTGGAGAAALNDRGFALIKQGRYAEAIDPLRASVAAYKAAGEHGLPYAYALFNLAVALNRSGNPAEAVPLLRERLTYGDQRKAVQAELDDARAKLAGSTAAPPGAIGPGPAEGKPGKRKGQHNKD
jgi:tetratricopeptide (TPR) repeat protein